MKVSATNSYYGKYFVQNRKANNCFVWSISINFIARRIFDKLFFINFYLDRDVGISRVHHFETIFMFEKLHSITCDELPTAYLKIIRHYLATV